MSSLKLKQKDAKAMKITISKKVLQHIIARHPEVKDYTNEITKTVQDPDIIKRGARGELKALKFYHELHIGPKYLVAVYHEFGEHKVIITAYFTSAIERVRGEVIWRK